MDDDETETLFGAPRRRNEPTHVLAALDDDVDLLEGDDMKPPADDGASALGVSKVAPADEVLWDEEHWIDDIPMRPVGSSKRIEADDDDDAIQPTSRWPPPSPPPPQPEREAPRRPAASTSRGAQLLRLLLADAKWQLLSLRHRLRRELRSWRGLPVGDDKRTIVLNDAAANVNDDYDSNQVMTNKYNLVTFVPVFLVEQFSKYANLFFLFIGCIQQIPGVSPTNRWTCLLYTSPSPRDQRGSRMPSSA